MTKGDSPALTINKPTEDSSEIRCRCSNMIGRLTARGIEVKCRRCKRIHVIPLSALDQFHHPANPACR